MGGGKKTPLGLRTGPVHSLPILEYKFNVETDSRFDFKEHTRNTLFDVKEENPPPVV